MTASNQHIPKVFSKRNDSKDLLPWRFLRDLYSLVNAQQMQRKMHSLNLTRQDLMLWKRF